MKAPLSWKEMARGRVVEGQDILILGSVWYFATKDRLKRENIRVVYCPTEAMVADYFTKPLQGALFKKLRAVIMGHTLVSTLSQPSPTTSE